MKRRRVSAAFVELDSAEVIQTKDEKASLSEIKGLASSRDQIRRSPRIVSKAGTAAEVNITTGKGLEKEEQQIPDGWHRATINTQQTDDSSHLADIASKPNDIEHAMSTASQPTADKRPNALLVTGKSLNQDNKRDSIQDSNSTFAHRQQRTIVTRSISVTSSPQESVQQNNHANVASTTSINPDPKFSPEVLKKEPEPASLTIQQPSISSKPRRSHRKTNTPAKAYIDWNEDLHPTDEDKIDQDGMEGVEVSLPSIRPEVPNQLNQNRKRRRRAYRPKTSSKLRRQQDKKKASRVRDSTNGVDTLPLTTIPLRKPEGEARGPNIASSPAEVVSNSTVLINTADSLKAVLPIIQVQQSTETEITTNQPTLDRDRVPSCSPGICDQPIADVEISVNDKQVLTRDGCGRGKTVGEKLADALHGSQKITRSRRTPGEGVRSVRMTERPSSDQRSHSVNATTTSPTRKPHSHNLAMPKSDFQKMPVISSNVYEGPTEPDIAPMTSEMNLPCQNIEVTVEEGDMTSHQSPQIRGCSSSMEPTGNKAEGTEAIKSNDMREDNMQTTLSSDAEASVPHLSPTEDGRKAEKCAPSFESETDVSSQIPAASERNHPEALLHPSDNLEQTPDSQKPLLPGQSHPRVSGNDSSPLAQRSRRRSCAVDHNGSPRLKAQDITSTGQVGSHLELDRIRTLIGMSDSSSICSSSEDEESLEVCSLEHEPVARPIWTKFQRDMMREYGIEAEELIKQRSKHFLFSGNAKDDLHVKDIHDSQQLEKQPVKSLLQGHQPEESRNRPQGIINDSDQCSDRKQNTATFRSHASQSDPTSTNSTVQGNPESMEWISALHTAQKTAHDQLLETNQHLSTQLAAEQESIREVLQIYRQGCNRMLQELFHAQELRMSLYQQQMASVKEQHKEICQDLIRGLQELDYRVQQGSESRGVHLPHIP